jgi:hypothetical protein
LLVHAGHRRPLSPDRHDPGRNIDYVIAPIMIAFAVFGGILAANPDIAWPQVFAVTGIGETIATGTYAIYLARAYARLAKSANVSFP